jgi:hypothetical protein
MTTIQEIKCASLAVARQPIDERSVVLDVVTHGVDRVSALASVGIHTLSHE